MQKNTKHFSIIEAGLQVDGDISTRGKLIVKGTVKGNLSGESVIITEEGFVYADAKVGSMTIGGTFEGNVRALEELRVLPSGSCSGKVVCKNLVVNPGGILNAEVTSLADTSQISENDFLKTSRNKKK